MVFQLAEWDFINEINSSLINDNKVNLGLLNNLELIERAFNPLMILFIFLFFRVSFLIIKVR